MIHPHDYRWTSLDAAGSPDHVEDSIVLAFRIGTFTGDVLVMRWQKVQWMACGLEYCVEPFYN